MIYLSEMSTAAVLEGSSHVSAMLNHDLTAPYLGRGATQAITLVHDYDGPAVEFTLFDDTTGTVLGTSRNGTLTAATDIAPEVRAASFARTKLPYVPLGVTPDNHVNLAGFDHLSVTLAARPPNNILFTFDQQWKQLFWADGEKTLAPMQQFAYNLGESGVSYTEIE